VITSDLRRALAGAVEAAGLPQGADPGLRPAAQPGPGRYAASLALSLGPDPHAIARALAETLAAEPWIETAEVTGPGYLTITVTREALTGVADRITRAGAACATSGALAGRAVAAPRQDDPLTAATWEKARQRLAVQVTARLAAAAGATVADSSDPERLRVPPPAPSDSRPGASPEEAVSFAGRDAVLFTLARAVPGRPMRIDPAEIARHVPGNPAYAVRYAHARAASGVRWGEIAALRRLPADPAELALLDALSWLPERVATAARRDRPDEFARYLEDLASVTIDVLTTPRDPGRTADPGRAPAPGSDRLSLASAARTGLAAGLGLLGLSAPARL
jgi:arginyl-tRNA synthetase